MPFLRRFGRRGRRALLLAAFACLCASREASLFGQPAPDAAAILDLLNDARDRLLLPPLELSPELARAAEAHVRDMIERGYLDFRSPQGADVEAWARDAGYDLGRVAEKLLETNAPLQDVIAGWRERYEEHSGSVFAEWPRHFGAAAAKRATGDQTVYALVVGADERGLALATAEALRDLKRVRAELAARSNAFRESSGRRALTPHPVLDRVAQAHAEQLLEEETGGPGARRRRLDLASRAAREGYRPRRIAASNVVGPYTPEEAAGRWIESAEHSDRLLEVYWTDVGNGVAFRVTDRGLVVSWSQVYANRAGL